MEQGKGNGYKKENPAFSGGTFKTKPMKIILQ
jgi:hypothetical protein